jgi:hypothetical protein
VERAGSATLAELPATVTGGSWRAADGSVVGECSIGPPLAGFVGVVLALRQERQIRLPVVGAVPVVVVDHLIAGQRTPKRPLHHNAVLVAPARFRSHANVTVEHDVALPDFGGRSVHGGGCWASAAPRTETRRHGPVRIDTKRTPADFTAQNDGGC